MFQRDSLVDFFMNLPRKSFNKKKELAQAFREAAKDEELNAEFEIWDTCIGDGIDETNECKAR